VRKFAKWWLPVIAWLIVIFIGSSIGSLPRVGGQTTDGLVHRAGHVVEYAVLGALLLRALSKDRLVTKRDVILTVIMVALYGVSDEVHQRFMPGRSSEVSAVLFDVAGGLIGAWAYRVWRRRISQAATRQRADESTHQRAKVAMPDPES
jgi:VanZ family protein